MLSSPGEARRKRIEALRKKHQSRKVLTNDEETRHRHDKTKERAVFARSDGNVEEGGELTTIDIDGGTSTPSYKEEVEEDESSPLQVAVKNSRRSFSPGIERGLTAMVSRVRKDGAQEEEEEDEDEEAQQEPHEGRKRKKHGRSKLATTDEETSSNSIVPRPSATTTSRAFLPNRNKSKNVNISPRASPEDATLFDQDDHELSLDRIRGGAASISLLLQGLLAGFSIQTLFDAIPARDAETFILQYAQHANQNRRFYFLTITMCLSCSLCLVVPPRDSIGAGPAKEMIGTLPEGLLRWWWCVVVCYGTALILTLPIAVVDVQIFTAFEDVEQEDQVAMLAALTTDGGIDIPNIRAWRALSIVRSICCIAAWCLVCWQQKKAYERRREIMSWYN